MPVLIHTGPQRRKSLCDFPLCLLVEGSAPSPFEHRISFCGCAVSVPLRSALNGHPPDVQCLQTLLIRTSLPLAVVFFFSSSNFAYSVCNSLTFGGSACVTVFFRGVCAFSQPESFSRYHFPRFETSQPYSCNQ